MLSAVVLYLIEILHQTTTASASSPRPLRCILLKFYIKPQPRSSTSWTSSCCILLKFYIKPQHEPHVGDHAQQLYLIEILHQTTTYNTDEEYFTCCILLKFYIKPQPFTLYWLPAQSCILLKFYIKPQLFHTWSNCAVSCILLKFYIKPQQSPRPFASALVVSYWNSTSNHNYQFLGFNGSVVVSYWNSTSNHNPVAYRTHYEKLYLIEILHQTTTIDWRILLT